MFDAGDDIDALMILCRADITSKNFEKVNKFLKNFDLVEQKIAEVEQKDHIRNFQPPVTGDEIMKIFNIPPGRVIGEIKEQIKEAILEGDIKNDREEAMALLMLMVVKFVAEMPAAPVTVNGWSPRNPTSGNGWENQALFGFDDRLLPAARELRE